MKRGQRLTDSELAALIRSELYDSAGYHQSELSASRRNALDRYLGRPYGDEEAGKSSVVSRDTLEVVETILADLIPIFAGTDNYVTFEPNDPDDAPAAEQETEYVNYVVSKECDGFQVFHDWFKDALLSKNGVCTWWWEENERTEVETYRRLTDEELQAVLSDDGAEPVEHSQYTEQAEIPDPMTGQTLITEVTLHDVRIARTFPRGEPKIYVIPPEEFYISRNARSIEEATFCAYRFRKTVSELRDAGYSESDIERLNTTEDEDNADWQSEDYYRDVHLDANSDMDEESEDSMRRVWLYTCYVRADYDGDGKAELRRVVYAQDIIFENEPVDHDMPFASLCPVPMPHRFHGQSVADLVEDIARIKTTLWRQMLDNVYLSNNPMKEVVSGQVNIDDLLTARVGGLVRTKQPGMVREIVTTPMVAPALQALEFTDQVREHRAGISRYNQGLDPDTLNKTATGVQLIQNAAMKRVEMIARIFAETGVKRLFLGIHEMLQKNQNKEQVIRLRNQWVSVNPSEWRRRENMTVTVGLGTGNKDQQLLHLNTILAFQEKAMAGGLSLVTEKNIYNALSKLVENAGLKDPELYFTDPTQAAQQPQPEQQDPTVAALEMQAQVEAQRNQVEMQKAQMQSQTKQAELESRERIEAAKLEQEAVLKREEMQLEAETKLRIEAMKQECKRDSDMERLAAEELRAMRQPPVQQ